MERSLTSIDLAAEAEDRFAYTCSYDGAVLSFVVDDFVLTVFDELP